jgi:hypothetical protein
MIYSIDLAIMGIALILSAVNMWALSKKWSARKTWKAAGFISPSQLENIYKSYSNFEEWASLGLILCVTATTLIADFSVAHLLQPLPSYAWIVRLAPLQTVLCMIVCYTRLLLSQRF